MSAKYFLSFLIYACDICTLKESLNTYFNACQCVSNEQIMQNIYFNKYVASTRLRVISRRN